MRCPVALTALLAACATAPRVHGPLPVRNQHPAQLTVQHLDPGRASTLPQGVVTSRLTMAYTSLYLFGSTGTSSIDLDGEVLRTSLQLRAGVLPGLEFGIELPFVHSSGGFLDGFLIGYHDLFGLPDQGRDEGPRNVQDVRVVHRGATVYELESGGFGLADVPLSLRATLLEPRPDRPGLALLGGVELPTGDSTSGYGNGQLDVALGLAAEWPIGFGSLFGHVQHTFAGTPVRARSAGIDFADVTSAGLGFEYPLTDDLQALLQCEWENSTLRQVGTGRAGRDQVLLWLGGRLRLRQDLYLELSIGEDLRGYASPDVTAWLALAWLPGQGS